MREKQTIFLIGGGGREAAIARKLSSSPRVGKIYCAPGNDGMGAKTETVDIAASASDELVAFAEKIQPDFVFVAPDDPLAEGLCDLMRAAGFKSYGPSKAAARIEASKSFAKELMKKKGIPTASYELFTDPEAALHYIETAPHPLVVKADGLALGKGVLICRSREESRQAVRSLMIEGRFAEAGKTILIEEFLEGEEMSLLCFCDGMHYLPMLPARDYKRALDHDQGLNTGGMGSICPSHRFSAEEKRYLRERIIEPTLEGMRELGCPFSGVLYFGLMLTADGPKIIEYNARFGDPETQAVLPLLKTDLLEVMEATEEGRLDELELEWEDMACACVILASGGYPKAYEKGKEIKGLAPYICETPEDALLPEGEACEFVYPAGVVKKDGKYYTDGGRVLGLTARDSTLEQALERCYRMTENVVFEKMHFRRDIGS